MAEKTVQEMIDGLSEVFDEAVKGALNCGTYEAEAICARAAAKVARELMALKQLRTQTGDAYDR